MDISENSWQAAGKLNETVNCLLISSDNNIIYAGTKNGIYKASNHDYKWELSGLAEIYISSLLKNERGDVFAGSHNHGVFCLSQASDNWSEFSQGLSVTDINHLAINESQELFAATDGGVFKTDSNGFLWYEANNDLPYPFADNIIIDKKYIYLATDDGLFFSDNNAESWQSSNLRGVFTGVLALNRDGLLLASTNESLSVSDDHGMNWKNIGLKNQELISLLALERLIIAGTDNGFYFSENQGKYWQRHNSGLGDKNIFSLLYNDGIIYAGTASGIFYLEVSLA